MKADKHQSTKAQISPELVARAKSGDHDAFSELYKQTSTVLYRSIRSMVRDEELAWDIQQDSYLKAYQNLDKLKEDGAFLSWLRTISVHVTATRMRQHLPINFTDMGDEEDAMPEQPDFSIDTQPELALDRKETARLVREILAELPEAQQLVLGMRYYEDLSVKEISELLNLAPSTVSTQLNRGRKKVEAAVRSLEKQGLKLYGLSPLAFLLALERNQEPVAIAQNRVMQRILTKTTELGGQSVNLTAKPIGTGFFLSAAGKITAGVLGLALTGAAIVGLQGALSKSNVPGGEYRPTETAEAALLAQEPTENPSRRTEEAGQKQTASGADLTVIRPTQKLDYFVRVSDESCDRFSNGETDILYYPDGSVFRYDVAAGERELLTSQELPADADVERSLIGVTAQRLYFRDLGLGKYNKIDIYSVNYQSGDRQECETIYGIDDYRFENGWLIICHGGQERLGQQDFLCIDRNDRQSSYGPEVAGCGAAEDGALYYLQLAEGFDSSEAVPEGGVDFRVFRQLPGDSSEEIGVWHGTGYYPDVAVRNDTIAIRIGDAPEEHYDTRSFKRLDGDNACGENLVWSFDEASGTLSLTGSGEMYDYYLMAPPWCQFWESIQALALPEGLTSIGESAFAHCSGLNAVSLPASLKTIGARAFACCGLSAAPELPEGLTEIGEYAFCHGINHLGEIRLPSTLSRIGQNAFEACGATAFHVAEGNSAFSSDACGVLFNGDKTELLYYPDCRDGAYEIPSSVSSIGNNAFEFCTGLTEIRFPDGLTGIGVGAFSDCTGLTRLDLPDTLTKIESFAFSGCSGLTELKLPAGLTAIGNDAFEYCYKLESVSLPTGLTSIGARAFGCTSLTELHLPAGLTTIETVAFEDCRALTEVTVPAETTFIGKNAFDGCLGITGFRVAEGNPAYRSDSNGVLFNQDMSKLIRYPEGKKEVVYEIPASVNAIGENAFQNCDALREITFPEKLSSIGAWAFSGCSGLTKLEFPSKLSSIGWGAFCDCTGLTKLELPASLSSLEECAFSGCTGLTEVILPEGLTVLKYDHFSGCHSLEKVTFPAGITEIEDLAFNPALNLTIYGTAGTAAQTFAENYGFHFVPLGSGE